MDSYLDDVTADYSYDLVLRNQNVMPERGEKPQKIHTFDDGSISVSRMSDDSFFDVEVQFTAVTIANSDTILNLWHNKSKANQSARTFYWQHPATEVYYTVRFMGILTRKYRTDYGTAYLEVESFTLRIEGTKP